MATRVCKTITATQADTFPLAIWTPADGKFVNPMWYSFSVINKGTGIVCCDLNMKVDGSLSPMVRMGADEKITVDSDQRDLPPDFTSDLGDGSTAVITLSTCGTYHTSTDFVLKVAVWGIEV